MDEIVKEFLIESAENLDKLDRDFVTLEKNPGDKELLSSIFRVVHTIKGTCGFLGFQKLESVTHAGENILGKLRDGQLVMNADRTSALLALVDAVRKMLAEIEKNGKDGNGNYNSLISNLTRLLKDDAEGKPVKSVQDEQTDPVLVSEESRLMETSQGKESAKTANRTGEISGVSETAIRVEVGLLDRLMNLVGELVLARNQILQFSSTQESAGLGNAPQRLSWITSELQEGIMKTRMQPIGNVWSKFPRVVRDLAASCGKKVRLEMEGKETELDKTLIEAIKDPLTHIVRNSIDHGIESPEKRREAGKDEEGLLSLKAYHEGGQVHIEIMDDGGGISSDKIRDKALSRGLISPENAKQMSERDLFNLIFLPGFSTAEKITHVSGRGVGMDVVKTNIERINGVIDIQSNPGQGTTLKIKIPLTLAIIPALMVTSKKNRYAIPQVNLLELVRLEEDQIQKEIQLVHGAPVYQLRGHLLPLVFLNQELALSDGLDLAQNSLNIVVLKAGDHQFGLVVDAVNDTQEIVVKPLTKILNHVDSFAGATILGDGKVALILNVMGLAHKAHLISANLDQAKLEKAREVETAEEEKQMLLLVKAGYTTHMAIPMRQLERIEKLKSSLVETAGDHDVIQYRGKIMPLINIGSGLPERRKKPRKLGESVVSEGNGIINVAVYTKNGRSIGFVVDRVYDVVEVVVEIKDAIRRDGVVGTTVIQGNVTEILDVDWVLKLAPRGFFENAVA
jgi:two-component system chemotaxis sensor kinase CheA